ncbi:hypothetical protein WS89_08970 [Burkholderia sp. MSMB1072]|nr:hypothetical protein WS89_08970 [Burkholderia sp. MSMB1072]
MACGIVRNVRDAETDRVAACVGCIALRERLRRAFDGLGDVGGSVALNSTTNSSPPSRATTSLSRSASANVSEHVSRIPRCIATLHVSRLR